MSTAPQPMIEDLRDLLIRAQVQTYIAGIWFHDAKLAGKTLIVPDEPSVRFIERQWGAAFREHIPDLRIRVKSQEERLVTEKKQAKATKPIWNKAGREYHAKRLGGID